MVGFTIRLVFDGFTLGPPEGPRERYGSVEALVARLEAIEASGRRPQLRRLPQDDLDKTELGRRQKIAMENRTKPT